MNKLENYEGVRVYISGSCDLSELDDFISWFKENYNSAVEVYDRCITEVAVMFFENSTRGSRLDLVKEVIEPKLAVLNAKNPKGYEFFIDSDGAKLLISGRKPRNHNYESSMTISLKWV